MKDFSNKCPSIRIQSLWFHCDNASSCFDLVWSALCIKRDDHWPTECLRSYHFSHVNHQCFNQSAFIDFNQSNNRQTCMFTTLFSIAIRWSVWSIHSAQCGAVRIWLQNNKLKPSPLIENNFICFLIAFSFFSFLCAFMSVFHMSRYLMWTANDLRNQQPIWGHFPELRKLHAG